MLFAYKGVEVSRFVWMGFGLYGYLPDLRHV
jgi:hypothetical protein